MLLELTGLRGTILYSAIFEFADIGSYEHKEKHKSVLQCRLLSCVPASL